MSMAKINTLNVSKKDNGILDKGDKYEIPLGIGTNPETINDWVNEIWDNYVKKDDKMLRKYEFVKFVKTVFKMTNSSYEPSDRDLNTLFDMIGLEWGKASKEKMYEFLLNLSKV